MWNQKQDNITKDQVSQSCRSNLRWSVPVGMYITNVIRTIIKCKLTVCGSEIQQCEYDVWVFVENSGQEDIPWHLAECCCWWKLCGLRTRGSDSSFIWSNPSQNTILSQHVFVQHYMHVPSPLFFLFFSITWLDRFYPLCGQKLQIILKLPWNMLCWHSCCHPRVAD